MSEDTLWFTATRLNIRLSNRSNRGGLSVMEHAMAHGFSPPLHVHHDEEESFYVLEGEFRFELDGVSRIARTGDLVHAPAGAVHSFAVISPEGGRLLTITDGGFEDMVREVSRKATDDGLPAQVLPSLSEQRALFEACSRNGILLQGPPLAA